MPVLVLLLLLFSVTGDEASLPATLFTNHWAVRIRGGARQTEEVACKYGFTNLGQVKVSSVKTLF